MPTFEQIISAEFGFAEIKDLIFKIYTHPFVDGWIEKIRDFISGLSLDFYLALAVAAAALAFALFGKRFLLMPAVLVGFFGLGFVGGYIYLAPMIDGFIGEFIPIDPTVIGFIFAIIAAVLFLPLYYAALAVGSGYAVYLVAYPILTAMLANVGMFAALGCAAAAGACVLLFRKWFEMLATAAVGAYIFMQAVNLIVLLPEIANYIIWGGFALIGLVVQFKTRKRY